MLSMFNFNMLEKLDITFENTEYMTIDSDAVAYLEVEDISTTAIVTYNSLIYPFLRCSAMRLHLDISDEQKFHPGGCYDKTINPIERLKQRDIVQVILQGKDETNRVRIDVPYLGEIINEAQEVRFEGNNLIIEIS